MNSITDTIDFDYADVQERLEKCAENVKDTAVAEHIIDEGIVTLSERLWLPGVYSEDDDDLRDRIVAELGPPVESGYMSEECGWGLDKLET